LTVANRNYNTITNLQKSDKNLVYYPLASIEPDESLATYGAKSKKQQYITKL
jgi:hypothetical protein